MVEKDIGSVQRQLAKPGGKLQKYKEATVGDRSLFFLLLTELAVLLFGSVRGPVGAALRRFTYRPLFKKLGAGAEIGTDCSFRLAHRIEIHNRCRIQDEVSLNVKAEDGKIILGEGVELGEKVVFSCPGGTLEVGKGTTIGKCSRLGSLMGLTVGSNCRIGESSYIVGAGHAISDLDIPIINQPINCKGENRIGDNVVIGDRVTILDGVCIGDNVVVESDSVVLRDVEADCRVTGVPAVVVAEGGAA